MNFSLFDDDLFGWNVKFEEKEITTITLNKGEITNLNTQKTEEKSTDDFDNLIDKMFKHRQ